MTDSDLQESLRAAATQPCYSGDVLVDRLYDMLLRLAQELAVTREELAQLRAAVQQAGLADDGQLAAIAAAPDFADAQLQAHRDLVQRLLGDLPQQHPAPEPEA